MSNKKKKKQVGQISPVELDDEEPAISELNKRLLAAGIIKKVGSSKNRLANFLKYEPLELPGEPVTKILSEERDSR